MKVILKTAVDGYYKEIYRKFDLKLFEFLQPKLAKTKIVEFTGSSKGDIVHIQFLSPVKTSWISEISYNEINNEQAYFIDKGTQLPWPLMRWEHKHIVNKKGNTESEIVDEIEFSTANIFSDILMWPVLLLAFYPRKRMYKQYFNN